MFLLVVVLYVILVVSWLFSTNKSSENSKTSPITNFEQQPLRASAYGKQSSKNDEPNIHILFSTSCSAAQDWQSYLLFYKMMAVNQVGNVTRLVSGCTPEERKLQDEWLEKIQTTMSPRFNMYFTELDFGKHYSLGKSDWQKYKYMNKPFSTLAFLQDALGFPENREHEDDLFVLIDPDMMSMRSFTNDFSDYIPEGETVHRVSHGHMFGQPFGYQTQWYEEAKDNLTYLVGEEESPVRDLSGDRLMKYHAGPPYMATGRDFYALLKLWCDILPRYQALREHFMVEMYSASLAAAHLGLPFHLVPNFMISDDKTGKKENEGWSGIDNADPKDLCIPERVDKLPLVFHYCQRFGLGEHFFNKHIFNNDFFSCDEPLMEEIPSDVALRYNYTHYGDGTNKTWEESKYHMLKRNAFMLCSMTSGLNDAATFYKRHHCGDDANYAKTWNWHEAKANGEIGPGKKKEKE